MLRPLALVILLAASPARAAGGGPSLDLVSRLQLVAPGAVDVFAQQYSATHRAYEEQRLFLMAGPTTDVNGDPSPAVRIVQGAGSKVLAQREFLELVGRHDLAVSVQAQRDRPSYGMNLVMGGIISGLAITAIGAGYMIGSGSDPTTGCNSSSPGYGACINTNENQQNSQTTVAIVLLNTGPLLLTGMVLAGVFVDLAARGENEAVLTSGQEQELVDEYNRHLRQKLGITQEEESQRPRPLPALQLSLAPMAMRGGGGLMLMGQF